MNIGMKHLPFISSSASWKSGDGVSDKFPAGLRVLVVDDDPTCLRILEKMLKNCLYEVTTSNRAEIALEFLRDNKNGYDIVISDVHMPDMDGFKLLERVGLEMDLPVIMMSADDSKNVVMKGVTHGACDYLIKPVRMEALKNIWQHVVRKKKHEWKDKDFEQSGSGDEQHLKPTDDADYSSSANERNWKSSKKRKEEEEEDEAEEREDTSTLKKPRVVWSVELHQQFVTAVNQLGIDKAVPKKILELMNVPGLTRENVASHLQKYRLYLRRLSGVSPHQNGLGNSFMGAADAPFVSMSSLSSVDLQALAASGQLPLQSLATIQAAALGQATPKPTIPLPLVNQRNIFGYENQKSSSKQANSLLHGAPTNMDSKQLATVHQSGLGSLNISQSHSLLQMVQPQSMAQSSNDVSGSHLANIPSSLGQPVVGQNGIDNVHGPPCITISPVNAEMKVPRGFVPSYDVFNDLNQNSTPDWRLQNVGSTLERLQQSKVHGGLDASPSVSIHNRLSANGQTLAPSVNKAAFSLAEGLGNLPSINQHLNSSFCDNPVRIKSERFPDTGFHSSLFPQRFGQEDLMSAILKQLQEGTGSVENEFGYDGYPMDNLPV